MATITLLITLFTLHYSIHFSTSGKGIESRGCSPWHSIREECKTCKKDCNLPVVRTASEQTFLENNMEARGIKATWLALHRSRMPRFQWLDCTGLTFTLPEDAQQNNCAFINLRRGKIFSGKCNKADKGVLCQVKDCSRCSSLGQPSSHCIKLENNCYVKSLFGMNWEQAKAFCHRKQWQMAVFSDMLENSLPIDLHDLSELEHSGNIDTSLYWIGLRREEWVYPDDSDQLEVVFWGKDEPRDNGNCSIIQKRQENKYEWQVVPCSLYFPVLCTNLDKDAIRGIQSDSPVYYRHNSKNVKYTRTLRGPESLHENKNVNVHHCGNWIEIMDQCEMCGSGCQLPVDSNVIEHRDISNFMNISGIRVAWLGLTRVWFGEFLWLDCLKPSGTFAKERWKNHMNCAYLNIRDREINAGTCSNRKRGVICQMENCSSCAKTGRSENCRVIGNTCYVKLSFEMNWMQARAHCRNKGWTMAIFSGLNEDNFVEQLSKFFQNKNMAADIHKFFWIGLRREEWTYLYRNQVGSSDIKTTFWGRGEPRESGNCSVIERSRDGQYQWRAATCASKHETLCYQNERTEIPMYETEFNKDTSTHRMLTEETPFTEILPKGGIAHHIMHKTTIILGLLGSLMCALPVVVLIALCRRKLCAKHQPHPEEQEMLEKP